MKVNKIKGTNIVHTFDDGSKVVQVLTKKAQKIDRDELKFKNNIHESVRIPAYFSLRDKHNNILANIELSYVNIFSINGKDGKEVEDSKIKQKCHDFISEMAKVYDGNKKNGIINNYDRYIVEAKARIR